jgi:hypothetical protein
VWSNRRNGKPERSVGILGSVFEEPNRLLTDEIGGQSVVVEDGSFFIALESWVHVVVRVWIQEEVLGKINI